MPCFPDIMYRTPEKHGLHIEFEFVEFLRQNPEHSQTGSRDDFQVPPQSLGSFESVVDTLSTDQHLVMYRSN